MQRVILSGKALFGSYEQALPGARLTWHVVKRAGREWFGHEQDYAGKMLDLRVGKTG
jgi:hypothetical protein